MSWLFLPLFQLLRLSPRLLDHRLNRFAPFPPPSVWERRRFFFSSMSPYRVPASFPLSNSRACRLPLPHVRIRPGVFFVCRTERAPLPSFVGVREMILHAQLLPFPSLFFGETYRTTDRFFSYKRMRCFSPPPPLFYGNAVSETCRSFRIADVPLRFFSMGSQGGCNADSFFQAPSADLFFSQGQLQPFSLLSQRHLSLRSPSGD